MKLFVDILLALPIGIIYSIFIHKLGEIINSDFEYKEKIQRNLILAFIGGIVGLLLVILVFSEGKAFYNRAVKFGLITGSVLLLIHVLLYNWYVLDNDVKLFAIMTSFATLIWYAYYCDSNSKAEKRKKILRRKKEKKTMSEQEEINDTDNSDTDDMPIYQVEHLEKLPMYRANNGEIVNY